MTPIILKSNSNKDFEHLLKIHKEDRNISRVLIKNNIHSYHVNKIVLFENENGFSIIETSEQPRISINNKMYFVTISKTSYILKDNKFYTIRVSGKSKNIKPFSFADTTDPIVIEEIVKRLPWTRFLIKNIFIANQICINTIIKNKLYSLNAVLKHIYKTNIVCAKFMSDHNITARNFLLLQKNSINFNETANITFFSGTHEIHDLFRMADVLNIKINCQWSDKRIKEEHDKMSKTITDIVLKANDRPLNLLPEFFNLEELNPELRLLKTTKDMALEGEAQRNCVAGYTKQVEMYNGAIFHYKGYTTHLIKRDNKIEISQIKGLRNSEADEKTVEELSNFLQTIN